MGDTLRETHDERQVKAKKDTSESRTPLGKAGDKWRETSKKTSKETDTTSQTGKQRKGDKWRQQTGRQMKRDKWRETSKEPDTPTWKEADTSEERIENPNSKLFGKQSFYLYLCLYLYLSFYLPS